jgi:signal transduction histidine kinase
MIISFIAAAIIAFTTGLLFSKRILKPITRITKRVQNITAYNLHLRLDVNDTTDEVTELAKTFNTMLDRLETAFETQNNFVSHASHEFNTPLTAIIGEAEYALARERTPEVYVQSIKSILQSAERLHGITQSLLQLAQTGLTDNVHEMNIIRIDYLLQEVVRMVQQIIPESVINFNDSLLPQNAQKLMIKGNEALLELAVSNILLNACKYSSNKPVQLALASSNKNLIIIVKDEGIGIPEDELKYIYDPFFRASNTNKYNGYGIGLPLTRNIIRIHKGELIVNSKQNIGTEIQIILPLSE